jgi:hypothetical protein
LEYSPAEIVDAEFDEASDGEGLHYIPDFDENMV